MKSCIGSVNHLPTSYVYIYLSPIEMLKEYWQHVTCHMLRAPRIVPILTTRLIDATTISKTIQNKGECEVQMIHEIGMGKELFFVCVLATQTHEILENISH